MPINHILNKPVLATENTTGTAVTLEKFRKEDLKATVVYITLPQTEHVMTPLCDINAANAAVLKYFIYENKDENTHALNVFTFPKDIKE